MCHLRTTYFIYIFFVLTVFSKAQSNKTDTTLLLHYYNQAVKFEYESPDSVLKYAELLLNKAIEKSSTHYQIKGHTYVGLANAKMYKFNEALISYMKAREVITNCKCADLSITLGHIGYIYLRLERYGDAYQYFKLQQYSSQEEKNTYSFLNSIINLYDYYGSQGMIDSSYAVLKIGLKAAREYKIRDKEAVILDNIANYFYVKSIETNDLSYLDNVKKYADTALTFHFRDKDSGGIYYIHGLLGAMYTKLKQYEKAEGYYRNLINYSTRIGDVHSLRFTLMETAELFAQQGEFKKAYAYIKQFDSINRVYLDEEVFKQIVELNKKYETEKKEQENKLLTVANEKKEIGIYFAIAAFVLLLVFFVFIFKSLKEKQKANVLINAQKKEVEKQNKEIGIQKELLEEKQKEIVDSIHYAKRIQTTLLAHRDFLTEHIPNNFVFFKPKDIVSGDFYWATKKDQFFYLAVCDSTGHGVPGAFMSLLNIGFLSEAINEKNISSPSEIFNYTRDRLENSVSKDGQRDGFDGVLIRIDTLSKEIVYAAANNKPIVISNQDIIELSSNRMPVGIGERKESFSEFKLNLKQNETLYLYTDGYADQFGGPKGKKFKYKKLNEFLVSISALKLDEQKALLDEHFTEWKGDLEQIDDVCIIGFKI